MITSNCVEDAQQLAHASSRGEFSSVSRDDKPLIEDADGRIKSLGTQRRHVEHCANIGASTPTVPFAFELTTIAVKRGHTHQRRDLAAVQPARLRQARAQGRQQHAADTLNRFEQLLSLTPQGASAKPAPNC